MSTEPVVWADCVGMHLLDAMVAEGRETGLWGSTMRLSWGQQSYPQLAMACPAADGCRLLACTSMAASMCLLLLLLRWP